MIKYIMNLFKIILFIFVFVIVFVVLYVQLFVKVESFLVRDVWFIVSFFKYVEDMDICYLLGIDFDCLLVFYLKEVGFFFKVENYINWENIGLDGYIGGYYLLVFFYMYVVMGNKEIKVCLDYMISELKCCQDVVGDGYLCGVLNGCKMWKEIEEGNICVFGFGLNDCWVFFYNIYKIYVGFCDVIFQIDSWEVKEMLVKFMDWMICLVFKLSDEQIQEMLCSEYGGLNEIFVDVVVIIGDKCYLKLVY